jgi:uncharacterized repeat protein (TIGR02543 family)
LTSVICMGTTPPTVGSKGGGTFPQSNLYVPASALSAYQQATWWKNFTSITGVGGSNSSNFLLSVAVNSAKAGEIAATSAQSGMYASGTNATVRATGNAGYGSFAWKNADGTTVSTANPYTFSLTANTTLIATWTPITYGITYDNTKNIAHSNPASYTVESARITLANLTAPAGYTFNGWFDAATGGNKVTAIATGSTSNRTLYAQWTTIPYIITYSCSDLKGNPTPSPTSYTVEELPLTLPALSKAGYTFGWYDAATGGTQVTAIAAGSTGNKTYHGRWTINTYTVTYSGDLKGVTLNPSNYTVESATFSLPVLSKADYTFNGWYDVDGNSATEIATGSTGDREYWASWTPVTYTITYSGDLKGNNPAPTSYTVESATFNLPPLSKDGYTFEGWYTASSGGTQVTEIAKGSTGNREYWAQWTPIAYTITYNELKGNTTPTPTSYTVETNTFSLPDISATGYTFSGWYDAETGGKRVKQVPKGSTVSYTLYGRWVLVTYDIHYHNTKNADNLNPATYNVDSANITLRPLAKDGYFFEGWYDDPTAGSEVTYIPAGSAGEKNLYARWTLQEYAISYYDPQNVPNNPNPDSYNADGADITLRPLSKTGYTFNGWYDEEHGGLHVSVIPAGSAGDREYWARWSTNTYTVVYYGNGATSDTTASSVHTYGVPSRLTPNGFVCAGHAFDGWALTPTGAKEDYKENALVSNLTATANGVVELYARWKPGPYTVAYHGNGATPPDTTWGAQHIYGTPSPLAANGFKRTGYAFVEWNTQPNGSGDRYAAGESVTALTDVVNSVVTLYAQWSANRYTVVYHGNGATGDTTAGTQHTYDEEKPLAANGFTRTGYVFAGWNTQRNGGGAAYAAEENVVNLTATANGVVMLYAQWTVHPYTVAYHGNGATGDTTVSTQHGYGIPSPLAANGFKRTGYAFVEWNAQPDGSGTAYAAGESVTALTDVVNGVVMLYAQWSANTYTVVYHGNGATSDTTESSTYIYDATKSLTDNGFKRTGYTFAGWNTAKDDTGTSYTNSQSVSNLATSGTFTLYAQWTANTYTVVYHGNGATSDTTASSTHTYDEDKALTTNGFKRTGYTFAGWNTAKDGSGTSYTDTQSVSNLATSGTFTLYAKWTANTYTVVYHGNGATSDTTASTQYTYDEEKPLAANGFTRTGYAFAGWNTQRNGGGAAYTAEENVVNLTATANGVVTLYAQWGVHSSGSHIVTFADTNGSVIATQPVAHGDTVPRPAAPAKAGYTFAGWYSDVAFATPWSFSTDTVTGSITLYARWIASSATTYTVTFNSNDGSAVEPQVVEKGDLLRKPADPVKAGYTFVAWCTDAEFKYPWDFDNSGVGKNMTLYAKWSAVNSLRLDSVVINGEPQTVDSVITYTVTCSDTSTTLHIVLKLPDGVTCSFPCDTVLANLGSTFRKEIPIVLTSLDGRKKRYTLGIEKTMLEFSSVVHVQLGARLLMVVNNPDNNGGHRFEAARWIINDTLEPTGSKFYYVPRNGKPISGTIEVHLQDSVEGWLAVCPHVIPAPSVAPTAARTSVYPNPVAAGGVIYVNAGAELSERYATYRLLDVQGLQHRSGAASELQKGLTTPGIPGVYFLILEGGAEKTAVQLVVGDY